MSMRISDDDFYLVLNALELFHTMVDNEEVDEALEELYKSYEVLKKYSDQTNSDADQSKP